MSRGKSSAGPTQATNSHPDADTQPTLTHSPTLTDTDTLANPHLQTNQGWQVFATGCWKKNRPGKNSLCRQKLVFSTSWQKEASAFSALTLLVGRQEEHPACEN